MNVSIVDALKNALAESCQGVFVFNDVKLLSPIENTRVNDIKHIPTELCVAFSGGLDSTVLLDVANVLCKKADIKLSAFHINHGISENSDAWQAHCQQQCEIRDISFHCEIINLSKQPQKSLEADARKARYDILDKFAKTTKVVLLAQHQNDQAETFLLQLKRGAGLAGLAAMPVLLTKASGTSYIRPFLKLSREELRLYATQQSLSWIEDESNKDDSYDRNFLRNQVVPILTGRFPSINKTIARSAFHCAQAHKVNTEYMSLLGQTLLGSDNSISISMLLECSTYTQQSFIRYWLKTYYNITPSTRQLDSVHMLTQEGKSGYIEFASKAVERFKDRLHVLVLPQNFPAFNQALSLFIDWDKADRINLNDEFVLVRVSPTAGQTQTDKTLSPSNTFQLPVEGVECVFAASNLGFKYNIKRPTKKLKTLYQEWGISPLQRLTTPVFVKNTEVLAVGVPKLKVTCNSMDNAVEVALCTRTTKP